MKVLILSLIFLGSLTAYSDECFKDTKFKTVTREFKTVSKICTMPKVVNSSSHIGGFFVQSNYSVNTCAVQLTFKINKCDTWDSHSKWVLHEVHSAEAKIKSYKASVSDYFEYFAEPTDQLKPLDEIFISDNQLYEIATRGNISSSVALYFSYDYPAISQNYRRFKNILLCNEQTNSIIDSYDLQSTKEPEAFPLANVNIHTDFQTAIANACNNTL